MKRKNKPQPTKTTHAESEVVRKLAQKIHQQSMETAGTPDLPQGEQENISQNE